MSQKKNKSKKRKSQTRKVGDNPMELQESASTKRFNSKARNLLYLDLIFLAACMFMESQEMITKEISGICTIIGAIILFVALYFQFVAPKNDKPKAPRL